MTQQQKVEAAIQYLQALLVDVNRAVDNEKDLGKVPVTNADAVELGRAIEQLERLEGDEE
jgi:hypothetical protein